MKRALITGIYGQDGSYLAEPLLEQVVSELVQADLQRLPPGVMA